MGNSLLTPNGTLPYPELDPIVRRVHQILLGSQVTLRGLNRRVAQQQLDLFKFAAGRAAHLRATAAAMPHAA
jgi:hypothetical protein